MGDDGIGIAGPGPADSGEMGEADFGEGLFGGISGITGSADTGIGSILANLPFSEIGLDSLFSDESNMDLSSIFSNMPEVTVADDSTFNLSKMSKIASMLASLNPATASVAPALGQMSIASSNNPIAGMISGAIGAFAGPVAAMAANGLGIPAAIGNTLGAANPTGENSAMGAAPDSSANGSEGMSGALPGLMGMYGNYQGQKQTGNMLSGLQSLYSQDSPYAQVLRQNLQRQDAAGGRRSQYGPREVELQAKLAQMASQQIPAMSQISNNQTMQRNQMLQQGLGAFQKLGGINALKDLFMQGRGGMYETANLGALNNGSMPNFFDLGNIFGNVPADQGYDFGSLLGG